MNIRIAIIEDETMVADMMAAWLSRRNNFQVVGCAANAHDALQLCHTQHPDVAMVDIQLSGTDGLTLVAKLRAAFPALSIIIVSCRNNPYCVYRAQQLGLHGYVDKMSPLEVLETAIRTVAFGGRYFSESILREATHQELSPDAFFKILTDREMEVLSLICQSHDEQAIARILGITPLTVSTHRHNIRNKLDIHDDRKLMQFGRDLGLDIVAVAKRPAGEPMRTVEHVMPQVPVAALTDKKHPPS
jgi:DNA-binding NarL/FixJ family response regulator